MSGVLLLPLLLALTFRPAAAAPDGGTDWELESSTPVSPGAPASGPSSDEGAYSGSERIKFNERMRQGLLDQLCKGLGLRLDRTVVLSGAGSAGADIERRLAVLPDNSIALVDRQALSVNLAHTEQDLGGGVSGGVWVSLGLNGASWVVRPLRTFNSCSQLARLLNAADVRTVVPVTPKRLAKMEPGELWKLPATIVIEAGQSLGVALGPHGGASLSLGLGQRGTAMMTVYRLGPKMIRFRLRLDHARFRDASGQVVASIPAVHLFAQPAGALKGLLDNAVAGELARYLAATFGVFSQSSDGEQLVLEFILDPTRPRDMERLSAILRGDFLSLAGMARQMAGLRMTPSRVQKVYAELKAVDEARLGLKARLPAVDLYHDRSHSVHLKVPVLFEQNVSAVTADDEIILRDRQGGRFRLFRADKTSSEAFGDVPFVGQYSKHSLQRSAQAFVYTGRDGRTGPPQAVYIQQEAFARQSAYDVRRMGEDINAIMRLAGSRGGRANPRLEIPLGRLLPLPESSFGSQEAFPNYRDGGFSLTVVLTQRAVADILKAPADLVVRCFANSLGSWDARLMDWMLKHGKIGRRGGLRFDRSALEGEHRFGDDAAGRADLLAYQAESIVRAIAAARRCPTPQKQARAFVDLLSGRDGAGVAFNDMLRVLIQLVDPLDITADLSINVNKGMKGERDVHEHVLLKRGRPDNPLLKQAGAAKNLFAQPSDLLD